MTYVPEKWLWSEADFEVMGWHDATIHAIAFQPKHFQLLFDIDYILEWLPPGPGETHFMFWVSPCTLVFENVWDLAIDLEPHESVTIDDLHRGDAASPRNAGAIGRHVEWPWIIECHCGEIRFRSVGFRQFIRRPPIFGGSQSLSEEQRGGISFEMPSGDDRRET